MTGLVHDVLLEPIEGTIAHAISQEKHWRMPLLGAVHDVKSRNVRIGLVCMMRQPIQVTTWLQYYVDVLQVQRFFVLVDDSPELAVLFSQPPWDALVEPSFAHGHRRHYHECVPFPRHPLDFYAAALASLLLPASFRCTCHRD
jgi:hypothetical protein